MYTVVKPGFAEVSTCICKTFFSVVKVLCLIIVAFMQIFTGELHYMIFLFTVANTKKCQVKKISDKHFFF